MNSWQKITHHPVIPDNIPAEDLYRAACIGAVTLMFESGDVNTLTDTILHAAAPESRLRSLAALENLTKAPDDAIRTKAIRQLHVLAILYGHPQAADFLLRNEISDTDPGWNSARCLLSGKKNLLSKTDPGLEHLSGLYLHSSADLQTRLLSLSEKMVPHWKDIMGFISVPTKANKTKILESYGHFTPEERQLLRYCSGNKETASLPADLFLLYEDETLRGLCLKHHLLPSDQSQEALFYFLSGQWDLYYASDSDYRRIRIAYEQKDPGLQRRLIIASRESGNNAWLRQVSGNTEELTHAGTLTDQHILISSLLEQKHWDRLWELLPNVPMLCMPEICSALIHEQDKASRMEEISFLIELLNKIRACGDLSPIPLKLQISPANGTALELSAGGNHIAVLYTDRSVLIWDKRDLNAAPLQIRSNQIPFRHIILSHDGKYLCADGGNGTLTVFSLPGCQAIKSLRGTESPLSGMFLQNDDRRLILTGQNGKGTAYTFPGCVELFQFDTGMAEWHKAAYNPKENRICGITISGECVLYDVNERRTITAMETNCPPTAVSEEFSGEKLSYVDKNNQLSCINLLSGKATRDRLNCGEDNIRRISEFNRGDLYLLGTHSGHIYIFDPTSGQITARLSFGTRSSVIGIWYDLNDATLYGCTSNGTVRCWDMNLFKDMCRILPLTQLPGIGRLEEFQKKYPEPGVKAAVEWMKTVIAWRRRFDIEVEFE